MISRRRFLKAGSTLALWPFGSACRPSEETARPGGTGAESGAPGGVLVNDVQSQLNATEVRRIVEVESLEEIQEVVRTARSEGAEVSIAGGRHAMGGQQFGTDTVLIDTTGMTRVLDLDTESGVVEVEGGIQWPRLIDYLVEAQQGQQRPWGIIQKQTGADRLSIGGALAANAHGRGLTYRPIIQDVESFVLIDADGVSHVCSRDGNAELFRLAIGGYGCFGIIGSVKLRLGPRRKIERVVEILEIDDVMPAFEERIAAGFFYGDFQYGIANDSDNFLRRGVFSCYRPVDDDVPMPERQELSEQDWFRLAFLSHADKRQAFDAYSGYYLSTSGQIYWSDSHQLSYYMDDYHSLVSQQLGETEKATEMITEIYVPRSSLPDFMADARDDFLRHDVNVIYGTIRLIERDDESFLAWAREPWACIIFNLHVVHTPEGIEEATQSFRRLIDMAIGLGGSYFLTYHRWATRQQVEACYPQFPEFLRLKRQFDPEERFQSEWYRHYRMMFADALSSSRSA